MSLPAFQRVIKHTSPRSGVRLSPSLRRRRVSAVATKQPDAPAAEPYNEYANGNPQLTAELVASAKATRLSWPRQLLEFVRSDHAGETGAVWIYRGAITASRWRQSMFGSPRPNTPNAIAWTCANDLIHHHVGAEEAHLRAMEELLEPRQRSILVGIWKIAGWILGFAPLFFAGPKGLFATVAAVETYVETHYMAQIVLLKSTNSFPELTRVLEACCADEVLHQTDAANQYYQLNKFAPPPDENLTFYNSLGWFGKLWFKVVEYGSKAAVAVAMKV